jgi:hypothetical protein
MKLEHAWRYIPDAVEISANPTNPGGWAQLLLQTPIDALQECRPWSDPRVPSHERSGRLPQRWSPQRHRHPSGRANNTTATGRAIWRGRVERECRRIDVADLDNTRIRGLAHTCRSTGGGRSADVTRSGWTSCARAMQDAGVAAIKLNIYYIAGDPHVIGREV